MTSKITPWRIIMGIVFLVSLWIIFERFAKGLGAVTNLTDQTPWGLWIGFDILAGVGLAAGGFVMAATVYVFNIKKYRPLVRMAILTAMLGYLLFVVGLVVEVGRPWNMWRCLTNWNIHSPLFEVAWCVMLYTTVLILEFSLVVFEKMGWHKLVHLHHLVTIPLVIIGVLLSTLHQSTLGTLFTIAPGKMHPFWYSTALPVHFFISCIAAGMGMVCFEAFLSSRFAKHPPRMDLLTGLIRAMSVVLVVYILFRGVDLVAQGGFKLLGQVFSFSNPAKMFWLENLFFVFIPLFIVFKKGRNMTSLALFIASFSVVLGFIMHRFNIAITSFQFVNPTGYFPSWQEFTITFALIAGGFVAAGLAVHYLPMHEHDEEELQPGDRIRLKWRDQS